MSDVPTTPAVPWWKNINIISLIIGVVGILWGFYTWYDARATRELTVMAVSNRAVIVNATRPQGIEVLFNGLAITDASVYTVRLVVWNAGRAAIKPDNVLQRVRFVLPETSCILTASVAKQTREVVNANTTITTPNSRHLDVRWDILESQDGFTIDLVVAGKVSDAVTVEGTIEGMRAINWYKDGPSDEKIQRVNRPLSATPKESIYIGLGLAAIGAIMAAICVIYARTKANAKSFVAETGAFGVMIAIVGGCFFAYGLAKLVLGLTGAPTGLLQ